MCRADVSSTRSRERARPILAAVREGYEAVGVEVTDAYYRLGGDRVRTALADGDERTVEASNGEQGIQLDAQKR